MECTQVLLSESFGDNNAVTERSPVATLLIEGEYHTIYNTENVIGRENSCDVVISNSAVSSKHAVIEAEDSDAHLIYDLGSTNKTKLGKMVLKPHVRYHINDGDCVTFGNVSAQYNISRKYLTTPVKGNTTLNSCSIPETPERLVSTLDLADSDGGKQKVDNSVLELSDTDLFDEKEADNNLYPKEIPSSLIKTSNNDIYEIDTLSFDENIENHVKQTVPAEDLNEISVISPKNNVDEGGLDIDPQELVGDEKHMLKGHLIYDKDKDKNNFGWEDFPEITSHVGIDSSSTDNLGCPKSKISSSFLDITNDDLKSDDHIPKNIGGVILSDLCKPAGADSIIVDLNKQDMPSTSKASELKVVNETKNELCSEQTSIEPKNPFSCDLKDGDYSKSDCYIPMSQNIDMFEESPEKTMVESPEKGDVYEMLTQVSIESKDINNLNSSIYDIQTQMAVADNDPESKFDKVNESSFISPPNTEHISILEPATQPSKNNDKEEGNNTSYLKLKVIDETDNNCSFSASIYEAATQPCLQNVIKESASNSQNQFDESMDPLSLNKQRKNEECCNLSSSILAAAPQSIPEVVECLPGKIDQNDTNSSNLVEVVTQNSAKILDSVPAESSNKTDQNESLFTTITEGATQPSPVEASIEASKQSHSLKGVVSINETEIKTNSLSSMFEIATQPYSLDKPHDSSEKRSAKDLSVCDWYVLATQPCQPTSGNLEEQEIQKHEITEDNDEMLKREIVQNSSFSLSVYEIATQPCPKDIFPEKIVSINETTINSGLIMINDEDNKNNSFSASISEIATQPCPKDIFSEKTVSIDETTLSSELMVISDEINRNDSFSASVCEIATQPCPKDIFFEKTVSIDETTLNSELTIISDEINKNNSFSASICEIATQPCPKDICSEKTVTSNETILNPESKIMNDEINKNSSFSTSICEIATQPCLLATIDKTNQYESVKNDGNVGHFDERNACIKLNIEETKPSQVENEIKVAIDHKISSRNMLPSEIIHEVDKPPLLHTETTSKILDKSLKVVKESSDDFFEREDTNHLSVDKTENVVIPESINNQKEITPMLDTTITESFFEVATQPAPCQADLILSGNVENHSPTPKVSGTSCEVEKVLVEVTQAKLDVDIEREKNTHVTLKLNDFPLTATLPNSLSDSFFEAATQPYKNDEGKNRTYPDPLTSICNNLSDDKIEEISDELMYGNISGKLEDENQIVHSNSLNKESSELRNSVETSDNNIYEALTHQVPLCSQKNILFNKGNNENRHEKISTQDLQRILESDDLTQKYDEFKKTSAVPTVSDHILSSEQNVALDDGSEDLLKDGTKKLCNVSESQATLGNKVLFIDSDSSQELNVKSNKKRCNVFPPDSESFSSKFLENEDSSQELNIKSNKKRCNIFPPDSQDITDKNLETARSVSKEECIETCDKKSDITSPDVTNNEIIKNNDIQKPNDHDVSSKIVCNTSVGNNDQPAIKYESMSSNNALETTTNHLAIVPKGKLSERICTSGKRNSKETKNKSPPERERESTYISRGNITLHSPKVLSELEEQFRLTEVAMSPTQLSVVSDIDDEIISSQEVNELDKQGFRRSIRNKKNTLSKKNLKNNQSPISHNVVEPATLTSDENLSKRNENKNKQTNSFLGTSKSEKTFKKFKKVSPVKSNTPMNEKLVKVAINEADIVSNNSDNSQNSEELGRGKRKRTRTSYEGFIIEEEKKRTPRKKLSFSNSEDSENMNNVTAKTEEIDNNILDELSNHQDNDVPSSSMKQTVSVVLHDIQKVLSEVTEPTVEKNRTSKKKTGLLSKKNETSNVLVDKVSNYPSFSIKYEGKAKQNETSKDKNYSFSFSEKLDELFNIWGPADRVKLSPRAAKKSYKLLAEGKTESASSLANGKKSHAINNLDKEPKPSTSSSNKSSLKTNEKKNEPISIMGMGTSTVSTNRKRNLPQKNEAAELSEDLSKQNKKRRKTNSENSETSLEPDTNDHDSEVRKSSRVTRKKTLDIPDPNFNKPDKNPGLIKRASNELSKKVSNRTEDIGDSALVSNKNVKASLRNSGNTSMKPPLNTVIVNAKNKNLKTKEKNPMHSKEHHSPEMDEENYCFSQEYSFHENKIEKGRKKPNDKCPNPLLKIRRSGRKRNEKTADKNVENVMFTGFADKKTKSLVNVLGGQIVESPFTCTVLVTDKIRRTTKFLSALSRGLPIVSPQWLIESNENGRFLDSGDFLLSDSEAETMFSFNLKKSIEQAQNGKVLDGWAIFVTPSVKPSPEEMKSIIECSGGRFLYKELTRWPTNSLIVSCDEDRAMWSKFSKRGKAPIIVDNEAILLGVLRQELDLESHRLL